MSLNSNNALPLYQQLTQTLRSDIEHGKYKRGQRIPTEQELSKIYSVSRVTVRGALSELTKENLLARKQGKGTYVANELFRRDISRNTSFSEICRETSQVPGAKTIKSVIEDASDADLAVLHLEPDAKIMVLERIRYADGVPVAVEISRFPESFMFLMGEDLNNASLLEILSKKHGITFQNGRKTIKLVFASYAMAKYLSVANGYPLIFISSIACNQEGVPSHHSLQYIVGDRFELYV